MEKLTRKEFKNLKGFLKNVKFQYKQMAKSCKLGRKALKISSKNNNITLSYDALKNMAKCISKVEDLEWNREELIEQAVAGLEEKRLTIPQGLGSIPFRLLMNRALTKSIKQRNKTYQKIKNYKGLRETLKNADDTDLKNIDSLMCAEEWRRNSWSGRYY